MAGSDLCLHKPARPLKETIRLRKEGMKEYG